MLPAIVRRGCLLPERETTLGSGQRGSGRQSRATIADNNPFLLHVAVPNSFSTMAEITATTSLVVEIPQKNGYPNNKEHLR